MSFHPNVTTLRSGLCYRKSSVVCNVRAPYTHGVETFGNISSPFRTLAIFWPPCKISRRSSQETPPSGALNARGVSKLTLPSCLCYIRVSHLLMSFLLMTINDDVDDVTSCMRAEISAHCNAKQYNNRARFMRTFLQYLFRSKSFGSWGIK